MKPFLEKPVGRDVVKHQFLRSLQKPGPNQHGFSTTGYSGCWEDKKAAKSEDPDWLLLQPSREPHSSLSLSALAFPILDVAPEYIHTYILFRRI